MGSSSPAQNEAILIVEHAPSLDFSPGILQRHELVLAQTLLPEHAAERLNGGIIPSEPGHEKLIRL